MYIGGIYIGELIGAVILIALAILFCIPFVKAFIYHGKIKRGLSVGISSIEEIHNLLEAYPWSEKQTLVLESGALAVASEQTASMLQLKDGVLVGTSRRVISEKTNANSLRRAWIYFYETYSLMQYISKLCGEGLSQEVAALKNTANSQIAAKHRKDARYDLITGSICVLLIAGALIAFFVYRYNLNKFENFIGSSKFDAYSTEITLQEALDTFYPAGSWSCTVDTVKELQKEGIAYATWTGQCDVSTLTQIYHLPISFTFSAVMTGDDNVSIGHEYASINQATWYASNLADAITYSDLLNLAYGNSSEAIIYADFSTSSDINTTFGIVTRLGGQSSQTIPEKTDDPSAETAPPPAPATMTGQYDDFVGTWQDENGNGLYLFIGYGDETKQQAYAHVSTAAADFEAELTTVEDGTTSGVVMEGGASEPTYAIEILRYKYWLEVTIYYGELGFKDYIKFVPADPETCPYENPYYLD